jgi:hypothetical protein
MDDERFLLGLLICSLFVVVILMTGCALGPVDRPRIMYLTSDTGDIYVKANAPLTWGKSE